MNKLLIELKKENIFDLVANFITNSKTELITPTEEVYSYKNLLYKRLISPDGLFESIFHDYDFYVIRKNNKLEFIHCTEKTFLDFYEENKAMFEIHKLLKLKENS